MPGIIPPFRALLLAAIVLPLFQAASPRAHGAFTLTTIASLGGANGTVPQAALTLDPQGNLYGTTFSGGSKDSGTVFEVAAGTHALSTIATLGGPSGGAKGSTSYAVMALDSQGNLYGTTVAGGAIGGGTVFELAAGTHAFSTIAALGGTNGIGPVAGVTLDSQGNLYGTTHDGGANNGGTVFEVAAGTHALSTIANLGGANGNSPYSGSLTMDSQGNLYGTTQYGGSNGGGTVFEVAAGTHALSTIANLNGAGSFAGLTMDSQGNLYGTTYIGGSNNAGTVFEVAAGTHALSTIANLGGAYGSTIQAGMTLDSQGNLYGTTIFGGANNAGTVFEVAAGTHALSTIADLGGAYGSTPAGGLTLDSQGDLYGTTVAGGDNNGGTVFELVNPNAVVPEPSSVVILGQAALLGIALAARARSRRRRSC